MKLLKTISILLSVLSIIFPVLNGFSCPKSDGKFVNPHDYRSHYICSKYCPRLEYCSPSTAYFSRTREACGPEPTDWVPSFDLSGQFTMNEITDVFVQQDGYNVIMVYETPTTRSVLRARYVNRTHAIGVRTALRLINNCVLVFDARVVANNHRSYCYYGSLHSLSTRCDLLELESENFCRTY